MTTDNLYTGVHGPVLLQTAQLELFNLESPSPTTVASAGGSQRKYITSRLRNELSLPFVEMESLQIKTFGSSVSQQVM